MMFVTKVHVFNLGKFRIDREPTRRIKRIFYLCETLYIPNILFKRCDLSINNIHNEGVHRFLSKYLLKFNLWLKFPNGFRLILFCVTTPWKLVFEFELIKFNFSADCECKVSEYISKDIIIRMRLHVQRNQLRLLFSFQRHDLPFFLLCTRYDTVK